MRLLVALWLVVTVLVPSGASALCRCKHVKVPRCATPDEKHRIVVKIDLAVVDGTVEVITQSGPYHVPVADLDGKAVLFIFLPKGEVFQGFLQEAIPGSVTVGTMHGATAEIPTAPAFVPGEYEMLLFVDVATGGGLGPQRGDPAALVNTRSEPTRVAVR